MSVNRDIWRERIMLDTPFTVATLLRHVEWIARYTAVALYERRRRMHWSERTVLHEISSLRQKMGLLKGTSALLLSHKLRFATDRAPSSAAI